MAENDSKAPYIYGVLGVSVIALIGYGIYKVSGWAEWEKEKDKLRIELFAEYRRELEELIAYQAALADKGEITESDNQILGLMTQEIAAKEVEMERLDTSWINPLVDDITDMLRAMGLYLIVYPIAGYLVYQVIRWLFKKRPPKDPDYRDPLTGVPVATAEELKRKVHEHGPNPVADDILSAQAIYAGQPFWVQQAIAVEAGIYGRARQNWVTLSGSDRLLLAYAMALAVGAWMAAAILVPAAALLLVL